MFKYYEDISNNYIPNNLKCSFPVGKSYTKLDPLKSSKPYEEYDAKGNLIGYSWYQGETVNLEFNIDGEIVVESDALVYTSYGEHPTSTTAGRRAYNIVEFKSWTCEAYVPEKGYIWVQDEEFNHDSAEAVKSVYVSAEDYLSDKEIRLQLLNFRLEPVYTQMFKGSSKLIFNIDKELSSSLQKGIYYCSLTVVTDTINTVIFESHDCTLLVK